MWCWLLPLWRRVFRPENFTVTFRISCCWYLVVLDKQALVHFLQSILEVGLIEGCFFAYTSLYPCQIDSPCPWWWISCNLYLIATAKLHWVFVAVILRVVGFLYYWWRRVSPPPLHHHVTSLDFSSPSLKNTAIVLEYTVILTSKVIFGLQLIVVFLVYFL